MPLKTPLLVRIHRTCIYESPCSTCRHLNQNFITMETELVNHVYLLSSPRLVSCSPSLLVKGMIQFREIDGKMLYELNKWLSKKTTFHKVQTFSSVMTACTLFLTLYKTWLISCNVQIFHLKHEQMFIAHLKDGKQ